MSSYVRETFKKQKIIPKLSWSILKTAPAYNNISKKCPLCMQEKFEIITYKNPDELLNKKSELISTCRHKRKFMLSEVDKG